MNQIREAGGYAYVLRPKDFQNWKLRWFDAI
ncbi:Uncharacterised protein [Staphylococcus aureus]|nr:Uncharacterised protein [Staphylococcus aureus]